MTSEHNIIYFDFFRSRTSLRHEPHTCETITTTSYLQENDPCDTAGYENQKRTDKNWKRIPQTNAVSRSLRGLKGLLLQNNNGL